MQDDRQEFLLRMYDQMFNDINTHILVVWQSVGVVVGAFAVFALVQKNILPIDFACALMILLSAWLIAHIYDASYWYNRNLVIIANIERQFLKSEDLKNIHYYFGKHRQQAAMLTHLRIQYWLGLGIAILFLLYHFITRVIPGFGVPLRNVQAQRSIPYLVLTACIILLKELRKNRIASYREFLKNSPGISVDTTGIEYGVGHPPAHMESSQAAQSQSFDEPPSGLLQESLADAIRFWEPHRVLYNLVLSAVALAWLIATWPHFRPALTLFSLLRLAVLALLANVCYCAAYLVDIPMQGSASSAVRSRRRWALWVMGTLLAILMENYWIADEIYPYVN